MRSRAAVHRRTGCPRLLRVAVVRSVVLVEHGMLVPCRNYFQQRLLVRATRPYVLKGTYP